MMGKLSLLQTGCCLGVLAAVSLMGCGAKEDPLDKAAPPPSSTANTPPPTIVKQKIAPPPTMGQPGNK